MKFSKIFILLFFFIFTTIKGQTKVEKVIIEHDYAFNVDPTEFLGFKEYKLKCNVLCSINAAVLNTDEKKIITDIKNIFEDKPLSDKSITYLKIWKNQKSETDFTFELNYRKDDANKNLLPLVQGNTYTVVFYATSFSDATIKESDITYRRFKVPKTENYNCAIAVPK